VTLGVIVPVRGPAPYLDEALASVLGQVPRPDEVVVVDDGSPAAPAVPAGVRMVRRERSGGPAAARAEGLAASSADLIALADADDVWEEGKLAAQLEALERHPGAAVCFGRATVIGADGRPTGERLPELDGGLHEALGLAARLYERDLVPAASAVIRRAALEEVGGFDAGAPLPAASDWDLWLRLVAAGHSFVCEPRARIRYRRHAGGLTADVARLAEAGLAVHERHADLVPGDLRRIVHARDLTSLARGRIRQRRWGDARAALGMAARLEPPAPRERALRLLVGVPGLRRLLGRRDPYRAAASS
jgi:glycosyltransferase involved in cell wall biosynthesis